MCFSAKFLTQKSNCYTTANCIWFGFGVCFCFSNTTKSFPEIQRSKQFRMIVSILALIPEATVLRLFWDLSHKSS